MILSNGTLSPGLKLQHQQACLSAGLARPVRLYPLSIRELGGTTNVQGIALRQLGYQSFVHMEMSRPLRQALLDDEATRVQLLRCMQS